MGNVDNTPLLILEILLFNNTMLEILTTNTRMTVVASGCEKDGNWNCAAFFFFRCSCAVAHGCCIPARSTRVSPQAAGTHLLVVSAEGSITLVPHTLKGVKLNQHPFHISTHTLKSDRVCVLKSLCLTLMITYSQERIQSVDGCQHDGQNFKHTQLPFLFDRALAEL